MTYFGRMKHQLAIALTLGLFVWSGCSKEEGCTYPEACNFNEDAVVDDGSCDFTTCEIPGCTDPEALNYNINANDEDGSCVYDTSPTLAECVSTVDFDSYTYEVVAIGGQCWFAENLRTSVFQDGTEIPEEVSAAEFPNIVTPARTTYNANQAVFNLHGHLYNGYAAETTEHGGICPSGWHVPTEVDWQALEAFLVYDGRGEGMGSALKRTSGWSGGGGGTDDYGFNGLGGGHAWPDGNFHSLNWHGSYWSSTISTDGGSDLMQRQLSANSDHLTRSSYWMGVGCSVRCVAD